MKGGGGGLGKGTNPERVSCERRYNGVKETIVAAAATPKVAGQWNRWQTTQLTGKLG